MIYLTTTPLGDTVSRYDALESRIITKTNLNWQRLNSRYQHIMLVVFDRTNRPILTIRSFIS